MPFFSTNSLKSFMRRRGVASAGAATGTISRIAVASELLEIHGFHCEELDCGGFHWDELDAGTEEELDCIRATLRIHHPCDFPSAEIFQ